MHTKLSAVKFYAKHGRWPEPVSRAVGTCAVERGLNFNAWSDFHKFRMELESAKIKTGIAQMRCGLSSSTSKCPCCGSRQFIYHHGVKKCSYCRSEV